MKTFWVSLDEAAEFLCTTVEEVRRLGERRDLSVVSGRGGPIVTIKSLATYLDVAFDVLRDQVAR